MLLNTLLFVAICRKAVNVKLYFVFFTNELELYSTVSTSSLSQVTCWIVSLSIKVNWFRYFYKLS